MSTYYRILSTPRQDGLIELAISFGPAPAPNNLIVPAAIEALAALHLTGGRGILFNGPASLPVAMALAHAVAHLYQFVACFDPKLGRYVVAISHTPDYRPGDLLE